jgi:hypothetical protein
MIAVMVGLFTFVGFALLPVALAALAAAVSDARCGALASLRGSIGAATDDLGRAGAILSMSAVAWAFVALNLLVLPFLLMAFGVGGLGVDLSLVQTAFGMDRAATYAFAALAAGLLLDGVIVVAFAELQRDREAEREGARFEAFAAELEKRETVSRAAKERVA